MGEGWYEDPTGRAFRRWYDGAAWTDAVLDERGGTSIEAPHEQFAQAHVSAVALAPVPPPAVPRPVRLGARPTDGPQWWWTLGPALVAVVLLTTTWPPAVTWPAACYLVATGVGVMTSRRPAMGALVGLAGAACGTVVHPAQSFVLGGRGSEPGLPLVTLRYLDQGRLALAVVVALALAVLVVAVPAMLGPSRGRSAVGAVVGTAVGVSLFAILESSGNTEHAALLYDLCAGGLLASGALGVVLAQTRSRTRSAGGAPVQ